MQALILNITPPTWLRTKLAAKVIGPAAHWGRASGLRLREMPPPDLPGDDWVLCRTKLGGICGSDLAVLMLRQRPDTILQGFSSMPMIPGHENVAEVAEAGPAVTNDWVGRRVCVEPTLCCAARGIDPPCPRCRAGQFAVCESFGATGEGAYALPAGTSLGFNSRTGGTWGEYFVAHVSQLVPVPEGLTDEQAILTDPLACSLHAVLAAELANAERLCVIGAGVLGLGIVACLRAVGFAGKIDVFGRHGFQRDLAITLGATAAFPAEEAHDLQQSADRLGGRVVPARFGVKALVGGYDAVFDCVGTRQSVDAVLQLTRARGQVCFVGTGDGKGADLTPIWFSELRITGVYGRQIEAWRDEQIGTYQLVHKLLTGGELKADGLLTHTFATSDYAAAFATATGKATSQCIKAAFAFAV